MARPELLRQTPHLFLRGEVGAIGFELRVWRARANPVNGFLRASGVSANKGNRRALMASARAVSQPMPEVAPVMRHTFPVISVAIARSIPAVAIA